ncbi:MAG: hypothetical protein B6D39_08855 [Anaerolineae bacterium UTCFX2]|nr:hypothetical protein [Anaerolineae bacterium]MCZ7552100.1 hypothetical protein [Anaerolineales bacterium]OQY89877.1 MAG: hypothetical protein B6D39_08855 [Anaerolineae bacterium UTCFX2]
MRREEKRGPWYLLTGLVIGVLLGVGYTRFFQPVEYVETSPASLRQDFKDQYRTMIAAAYLANGDLVRARARLELLQDADSVRALTEQAQRKLAEEGGSESGISDEARALGLLAVALGQAPPGPGQAITRPAIQPTGTTALATPGRLLEPPAGATEAPTGSEVEPTRPEASAPERPSPDEPFVLLSMEEVCDLPLEEPQIVVQVQDREGEPVSGMLVVINWAGGEERFFTGLKPEKGLGYADFRPDPAFVYSVRIGEDGAPLGNISALTCTSNTGNYWGAIILTFGQP